MFGSTKILNSRHLDSKELLSRRLGLKSSVQDRIIFQGVEHLGQVLSKMVPITVGNFKKGTT